MRIYYIDESEGPRYYVRSALGVNAERWNGLHGRIQDWRTALAGDYSVPTSRELHACDLLAGRGKLARIDNTGRRLTPEQGAEIFMDGLRIIENAAHSLGGIEVVNVCLRKADVKGYEQVSLNRLLNRINTSVAADGRYAHPHLRRGRGADGQAALRQAQEPQPRAQQVRGVGGRRADEGHPHRADHRRPLLPKLPG